MSKEISEEEIIKYLKTIKPKNFNNYKDETPCSLVTKKQIKAIQGLLDLYNKEKEEDKRLKIELEIKKYCKVNELARELIYYKDLASKYQGSCISKHKIKEKIKEYQNKLCQDIEEEEVVEYENIIQVLKELLEE